MPTRLRIAVVSSRSRADVVRRLAPRFVAIADVQAYDDDAGAEGLAAVIPGLLESSPHVVVADPARVKDFADRLRRLSSPSR